MIGTRSARKRRRTVEQEARTDPVRTGPRKTQKARGIGDAALAGQTLRDGREPGQLIRRGRQLRLVRRRQMREDVDRAAHRGQGPQGGVCRHEGRFLEPQTVHPRVELQPDREPRAARRGAQQIDLFTRMHHEFEARHRRRLELVPVEHAFEQYRARQDSRPPQRQPLVHPRHGKGIDARSPRNCGGPSCSSAGLGGTGLSVSVPGSDRPLRAVRQRTRHGHQAVPVRIRLDDGHDPRAGRAFPHHAEIVAQRPGVHRRTDHGGHRSMVIRGQGLIRGTRLRHRTPARSSRTWCTAPGRSSAPRRWVRCAAWR